MLKLKTIKSLINNSERGDTIVEVLIAIAVAAFAIGSAYAIANKSLQRAITARERNQALNIIENQIADLKARYKYTNKTDTAKFIQEFSAESAVGPPYPVSARHFCLIDNASDPTDDSTWLPKDNSIMTPADYNDSSKYNGICKPPGYDTEFDVDINAEKTSTSAGSVTKTVYQVTVHWVAIGGADSQATIYYRF
jgi:type II secretory pathway pseudopilin PulG